MTTPAPGLIDFKKSVVRFIGLGVNTHKERDDMKKLVLSALLCCPFSLQANPLETVAKFNCINFLMWIDTTWEVDFEFIDSGVRISPDALEQIQYRYTPQGIECTLKPNIHEVKNGNQKR